MDSIIPADLKLKLAKRGYAYECIKCEEKFRGEKRRVRAHVYKYHLALDEVPFYCSLCHYMTDCERDIVRHVKGYKRHQAMVDDLRAEGKEIAASYTHCNPKPKAIGEDYIRQLSAEESQLVWLSRLRAAGPVGDSAGGPVDREEPVDQEDLAPSQSTVEEEQQVVPSLDPLLLLPEALVEPAGVVPVISLPDIDLPPLCESQELDILADILGDETESRQIEDEFPEDTITTAESPEEAQVAAGAGILSQILACMQDIKTEAKMTNCLLTTLNTAIRKNYMAIDELSSSIRAKERYERNRDARPSPYSRTQRYRTPLTQRSAGTSRTQNRQRK
jgi:hypothetical protein